MNTELIGKTWDSLSDKHVDLVETFYQQFFERFPQYRAYFPATLDRQMKRMVDTLCMVARLAENEEIVENRMIHVGQRHSAYGLSMQDMENFKMVFLEVLGDACGGNWIDECRDSWDEAFERTIIPLVMRGMSGGASSTAAPPVAST